MLGSTKITAVLGCGVDPADHKAVRAFVRSACDAGLSLLLIIPGTKAPYDGRTPTKRNKDDRAAQEKAREAGRRDWQKVKSPSGLALASSDKNVVLKYLDRYIQVFSDWAEKDTGKEVPWSKTVADLGQLAITRPCSVNLAVEVGGSGLVVVDADTLGQKRRFLGAWQGDPDSAVPPTVLSPGTRGPDGQWIHEPGNGHFWFTTTDLDYQWEKPTTMGAYTVPGEDGFAVLWDRRYVLIPPSRRPEGAYEQLGRDYPLPKWLADAIDSAAENKYARMRSSENHDGFPTHLYTAIDVWAEGVPWSDILEPLGWTPTARMHSCSCPDWTAPGEHASPQSATAHDSGCTDGRYTETNAPLHIWTDHPGEPFDDHVEKTGTQTLSKLQAVALVDYDGNVGKAMDALGLTPQPVTMPSGVGVLDKDSIGETGHDVGAQITLPVHPVRDEITAMTMPPNPLIAFPEQSGEFPSAADNYCEGCGAVVDQEHSPDCSVWKEHREGETLVEDDEEPDPDVFDTGMPGVPVIAPYSHWRDLPPPEFVIDGLVEHGGMTCIIGPPGVGKSTVALDMACHIATGMAWQGRKTLKTRVLYLPGEGLSGANQRLKAWAAVHRVDDDTMDDGVFMGDSLIQLGASNEAWGLVCEYVIRQRIGMVIFDTFARMASRLDENSASDVGLAILRFDNVRKLTNAGVMIVHHTAKHNPSSGRGSSALPGATDSELLISEGLWDFEQQGVTEFPSGRKIQLSTPKQKNSEQLEHPIPLLLRSHEELNAPYVTGVNGEVDPMRGGGISLARPVAEPDVETAIRVAQFVSRFPEQGVTRADVTAGVRPDSYTAMRKDAARAWRQKVAVAIDRALRYELIETASGQRLGARYVGGQGTAESARRARAAEVIGDEG